MSEQQPNIFVSIISDQSLALATATDLVDKALESLWLPVVADRRAALVFEAKSWIHEHAIKANAAQSVGAALRATDVNDPAWIAYTAWNRANIVEDKNPLVAGIMTHLWNHDYRTSGLEFFVNSDLLDEITWEFQQRLVKWAVHSFRQGNGVVGYITVDYVIAQPSGAMSPYEVEQGISYAKARKCFTTKSRGLYWGNLLTEHHMALLGGPDEVRAAGVFKVCDLGEQKYFVQLTERLSAIEPEQFAVFEPLFAPILPLP